METTKSGLLKILTAVKPGLAKKEIIEQMSHFVFTGDAVVTFNDRVCIHYPFDFDKPFSVKADEFYNIVKGLDSEEIDMYLKKDKLCIDTKRSKGAFSTVVEDDIGPIIRGINKQIARCEWEDVPEDFTDAINLVKFSASRDDTVTWSCVRFDKENVYCGEGTRFSWYKFDKPLCEKPFMIKAVNIDQLSSYNIKSFAYTPVLNLPLTTIFMVCGTRNQVLPSPIATATSVDPIPVAQAANPAPTVQISLPTICGREVLAWGPYLSLPIFTNWSGSVA